MSKLRVEAAIWKQAINKNSIAGNKKEYRTFLPAGGKEQGISNEEVNISTQ